jgi:hypothetical protein
VDDSAARALRTMLEKAARICGPMSSFNVPPIGFSTNGRKDGWILQPLR